MNITRRVKLQLALFTVIAVAAGAVMIFRYIDLPAMVFGAGHYRVTLELERSGGLYPNANVTYRGSQVGRVEKVGLTDSGVQAVLSLSSSVRIPSDLQAQIHSQSAVGEQFVDLLPRTADGPRLKNGDVIPERDTTIPEDIDSLLDATNRGLAAIPKDSLKTTIDESYTAVGGLNPELTRIVKGSTRLAIDADKNLDSVTNVIDRSAPILDAQTDTADAIRSWAANLATITGQLQASDASVAGVLHNGGAVADQARQLVERLQPTLPLLLANLVSVGQVALAYQPSIEQLLVLFPQAVAVAQAATVANRNTKQDYRGLFLDFNLNLNLPPVCNTGFLPPTQQRVPTLQDYPDRPPGDLYCRVPQDAPFGVRGARNYPCLTVPGKRAPTAAMCESDEQYVPLNDGYNWKGDPNATLSRQDVPQLSPGSASTPELPPPAPIAAADYEPATGTFVGPDGRLYRQTDLSNTSRQQTWQSMLLPPSGN